MDTVIIDFQYIISMYKHLNPKSSRPLIVCSTTIHVIHEINAVVLSRSGAYCHHFTAYGTWEEFLIYIARLPHISLSGSFSSISMTYTKQFSKSRPCAPGLGGELCSCMHEGMHHDGRHSSQFAFHFHLSIYDSYDITELVLGMVPGYPALVWVGTWSKTPVRVRNRQGIKPGNSLRVVTQTRLKPSGFWLGKNWTVAPFCGLCNFGCNWVFEFLSFHNMVNT